MKRKLLMVSMHFKSYYKFAGGYYGTNIKAEINLKKKGGTDVSVARTPLPTCSSSPWNH